MDGSCFDEPCGVKHRWQRSVECHCLCQVILELQRRGQIIVPFNALVASFLKPPPLVAVGGAISSDGLIAVGGAISSDGLIRFSSGSHGLIVLLDSMTWAVKLEVEIEASCVTCMEALPGGDALAVGCDWGRLLALDLYTLLVKQSVRISNARIGCMLVLAESNSLVIGGADGRVRVLDARTLEVKLEKKIRDQKCVHCFCALPAVGGLALMAGAEQLVCDVVLQVLDSHTLEAKISTMIQADADDALAAALYPACMLLTRDGALVVGCCDGSVRMFEVDTLELTRTIETHNREAIWGIYPLASDRLALGGDDGCLRVLDLRTFDVDRVLDSQGRGWRGRICCAGGMPGGGHLVIASQHSGRPRNEAHIQLLDTCTWTVKHERLLNLLNTGEITCLTLV